MKTNQQEMEQGLIPLATSENPRPYYEQLEDSDSYREGRFWKTEETFLPISEMTTEHLTNALRLATRRAGEELQAAYRAERKAETYFLKRRQIREELEKRGALHEAHSLCE